MNRRQHMILGGVAILVAFMLLARGGSSPLAAGFGFALLLCPIVMGTVMWLLMRQPKPTDTDRRMDDTHEPTTTSARR